MQTAASDVWSLSNAEQLVNAVPPTLLARCSLPPAARCLRSAACGCAHVARTVNAHSWKYLLFTTNTLAVPTHASIWGAGSPLAATCQVHFLDVYSCLQSIY